MRRWAKVSDVISIWVLSSLLERPLHGYEMLQRLNESILGPVNPGGLYRLLRELEAEGLVTSDWNIGGGPPRRIYRITPAGISWLKLQKANIEKQKIFLEEVLKRLELHQRKI